MSSRVAGWSLALRIARREAWRAKGRSLLVLVLIALPVLAVTAAAVVVTTSQVSGVESLDRRLGGADARVTADPGTTRVWQDVDPDSGNLSTETAPDGEAPGTEEIAAVLGDVPVLPVRSGQVAVRTDDGIARVEATEVDLRDPLTDGLFDLVDGRWPAEEAEEVVVNRALLDQGYALGDRLEASSEGAPAPTIVGVAESSTLRTSPVAAGPDGSLGVDSSASATWLVGGGPVTWGDVRALNERGAVVLSRAVVTDPPPRSQIPEEQIGAPQTSDSATLAVLALVVAMVLLEVVLLAGPAFAVGAKRQARSLALLASCGATPAQTRRTVLATAVVLGGVAALAGVVLGIGGGAAAMPLVQRLSGTWLGPFEVPWLAVLGVGGFGLLSAFLAALAPAVLASRLDVVAVLAGRRGEPRPSRRFPALGAALLTIGIVLAAYGARTRGSEVAIAGAAVLCVLGMVLLVPVLLAVLGRLARHLPLAPRYAVRDAARQRTRTAPAVAAVAATVAGVVALGIGSTSDGREREALYEPALAMGAGVVTGTYDDQGRPVAPDWDAVARVVRREVPTATTTRVRGLGSDDEDVYAEITRPGSPDPVLSSYNTMLGSADLVGAEALAGLPRLAPEDRAAARTALAEGRAVVFADSSGGEEVRIAISRYEVSDDTTTELEAATLPAVFLRPGGNPGAQVVLPESMASELGVGIRTVGLLASGSPISPEAQEAIAQGVTALGPGTAVDEDDGFYVERGYQDDAFYTIVLLVLGLLGGTLVLGGTLTATFLALSDARPDLATLAAIGASPRTRRGIAASYALAVGLVGAVLGAAVGFVPGLAAAVTLTRTDGSSATMEGMGAINELPPPTGPFIDVPWLLVVALVLGLPLLSAAVVGLATRSRLPLVARAA